MALGKPYFSYQSKTILTIAGMLRRTTMPIAFRFSALLGVMVRASGGMKTAIAR
jgi:hypothetical protein